MPKEFIKIDFNKLYFKAHLSGMGFQDGSHYILYLPGLQISAYGDTINDAQEMLMVILEEFRKTLFEISENSAIEMLTGLGWTHNKYFKREYNNNLSSTTYEDIKREFNIPDNTPIVEVPIAV